MVLLLKEYSLSLVSSDGGLSEEYDAVYPLLIRPYQVEDEPLAGEDEANVKDELDVMTFLW